MIVFSRNGAGKTENAHSEEGNWTLTSTLTQKLTWIEQRLKYIDLNLWNYKKT